MTPTAAPTTEQGRLVPGGVAPWALFTGDDTERVPELQWPMSVMTYALMRNDSQIDGLLRGATLPIRKYRWFVKPNGADDRVVQDLAEDLGLSIDGDDEDRPQRRRKRRFSWDDHMAHALLALPYGHMFFEQVGEVVDGKWRLRKLAPRMPNTISEIQVKDDGGLKWIKQNVGITPPEIGVDRLVAYVWDKEGANWVGRSMLRSSYRNWLVKDRLIRVDAIKHERNGVGMPVMEAPPGASGPQLQEYDRMAQQYKAGESGGGAIPSGAKLRLVGTEGSIPDTLASMRYHDEQMAAGFLEMFAKLGTTQTGSRALGGDLIDYFALAQEAIAKWLRDIANEHIVEDWVDWNEGEEAPAPLIEFDMDADSQGEPADPSTAAADALVKEIDDGNVQVDAEVEAAIRLRSSVGKRRSKRQRRVSAVSGLASPVSLPARPLRRQPYPHELRAAVDFAEMDAHWAITTEGLVGEVKHLQTAQIAELHDMIIEAGGDVKKLADLAATPVAGEAIERSMLKALTDGMNGAIGEAERQGVTVARPSLKAAETLARQRASAVDTVLARSISETAARRALALTGGGLDEAAVAQSVQSYLSGLTGSYLRDQLGGAVQAAINSGRKEVFKRADPVQLYASELLDEATCEECTNIDGTQYENVSDAEIDYPTGGYLDCLGGPRCRGTLVAVYAEDEG